MKFLSILALPSSTVTQFLLSDRKRPEADADLKAELATFSAKARSALHPARLLAPLSAQNSSNVGRRSTARHNVYAKNKYVGQQCERDGGKLKARPTLLFVFGECLNVFANARQLSLSRIEIVVSSKRQQAGFDQGPSCSQVPQITGRKRMMMG